MKILRLEASNIKKLRVVEITPDGSIVSITGKNGAGKTSVLDAIWWALAGKGAHGSKPVRNGAAKGHVTLDLGDLTVTRRFVAESGHTSIVVETKDGARYQSPQSVVERLVGSLSFDPLAFTRMKPAEQLETLRGMVRLDVDVDALDRATKTDYENRTETNRHLKSAEARLAQLDAALNPQMDVTPVDVNALLEQMATASEHNAGLERERRERELQHAKMIALCDEATGYRLEAAKLIERADNADAVANQIEEALCAAPKLPDPIDVSVVKEHVAQAQRVNAAKAEEDRRRQERHAAANDVMRHQIDSDKYTAAMKARDEKKAAAIAAAKMPIEGLSFGDGEVTYNGIPFSQASDAEQLRVSVALAMAANPTLRVLRIRDGNLLDVASLNILRSMAELNDYQVWMEVVQEDARMGFHMEDGSVVAVNGTRVVQDERSEAESVEMAVAG